MEARRCVSPCRGAQYAGPLTRGSPNGSGTIAWGSMLSSAKALRSSTALPISPPTAPASPASTPTISQRNSNSSPPDSPRTPPQTGKPPGSPNSLRREAAASQRSYTGNFKRGLKHGSGQSILRAGTSYKGLFEHDLRHGQGTQVYAGGALFEGEFRENRPDGPGHTRFSSGGDYQGHFSEGAMHGAGTLTLPDGSTFTGTFVRGLRHGQGTTSWPDGDTYTGDYARDVRSGRGVYTWKDGRVYTGEFSGGMRHGHGELTFPSGDRFEGQYANDIRAGPGVYTYSDGRLDRGVWRDTKLSVLDAVTDNAGTLTELSLALLAAARTGDAEQALALLATGSVCVDVCDSDGHNGLFLACLRSHTALINILLDNGANINHLTPRGTSALVATYRLSRGLAPETALPATSEMIEEGGGRDALLATTNLLLRRGADPNGSVFPDSILATAVTQHCVDMVEALLARGADPSLRRPETGGTILHEVVSEAVRSRLEAGTRASGSKAQSPLGLLAKLLKHGGDPNIADQTGCLPLHRACAMATPEGTKAALLLLQHGAQPDRRWRGLTPLHLAVSCGAAATTEALLAHHADPNEGAENCTLLQTAVMLIEPLTETRNTETASKFAENRLAIVERLLEAGADPTAVTLLRILHGIEPPADGRGTALDQGYYTYVLPCDLHTRNPSMLSALDRVQLNGEQAVLRLLANSMRAGRRPVSGVSRWCEECGRSVGVVLAACARCQRVFFCSQQCKMRGFAYHRRFCTVSDSSISVFSKSHDHGGSQTSLVPALKWMPQGHPDRPSSAARSGMTTASQPGLTLGIHPAPSRLSLFPAKLLDTSCVSPSPLPGTPATAGSVPSTPSKQTPSLGKRRSRTLVPPS